MPWCYVNISLKAAMPNSFLYHSRTVCLENFNTSLCHSECNASYFFSMENATDTKIVVTLFGRMNSQL